MFNFPSQENTYTRFEAWKPSATAAALARQKHKALRAYNHLRCYVTLRALAQLFTAFGLVNRRILRSSNFVFAILQRSLHTSVNKRRFHLCLKLYIYICMCVCAKNSINS